MRFTGFSITTANRKASLAFYEAMGFAVQEDKHGGGRSCVDAVNQHFDIDDAEAAPSWNEGSKGPGVVLGFEADTRDDVDELVLRLAGQGYQFNRRPTTLLGVAGSPSSRTPTETVSRS